MKENILLLISFGLLCSGQNYSYETEDIEKLIEVIEYLNKIYFPKDDCILATTIVHDDLISLWAEAAYKTNMPQLLLRSLPTYTRDVQSKERIE